MTKEELLRPRYKVLSPSYPYCPWEVDTILHVDAEGELFHEVAGYPLPSKKVMKIIANHFTNIFN